MSKSFQRSIFGISVLLLLLTVWGSLRSNVRADQKDGAYPEMEVYSPFWIEGRSMPWATR